MQASLFVSPTPVVACVDLPAFPLQLLLRAHPDWQDDPVVVVAEDRPLAEILWANRAARRHRIRRGMKFAQAQSLVARLHGQVVPEEEITAEQEALFRLLLELTPNVEPEAPGRYWLDPSGLAPLYGSLERWAQRVHESLTKKRFVASVVVGWQRGRVLAIARLETGALVLPSAEEEERRADPVPLPRLDISSSLLEAMTVLGVTTFGEFAALPSAGLRVRYGEEAAQWHALARGETWTPLRAERPVDPVQTEIPIEPPDHDHTRLLFGIKGALHRLLEELAERSEGVTALRITLELDHESPHEVRLETATPTLDPVRLVDLVRLRLAALQLPAAVERIRLVVESRAVSPQQVELLCARPQRDLRVAAVTLARLKASFGPECVVRARLVDSCLPEARFRWEPVSELPLPDVSDESPEPAALVRSVLQTPARLPSLPRHEREHWLGSHGAVETMTGPGRVSTGWWQERTERDYFWVETRTGEMLWLFREKSGGNWWLHGSVD